MIKCTNADKGQIMEYLKSNPSENCFLIGDVQNFDLDEDFIDFWKSNDDGPIECLLMRFYRYYHISAINEKYFEEVRAIVKNDPDGLNINGIEETIEKLEKLIPFKSTKKSFLAELRVEYFRNEKSPLKPEKAKIKNIDELFNFQKSIKEFNLDERSRVSYGNEIKTNTGRTYYIREKGRIVSSATIVAENSYNGMIIGVATAEEFRNKGYARACVVKICEEMICAGKNVLLFYNNPAAGKLYKDVGFRDINNWMVGNLN